MQLLEMVEGNELNRSLLTLLDENIANANMDNQVSIVFILKILYILAYMHILVKYNRLGLLFIHSVVFLDLHLSLVFLFNDNCLASLLFAIDIKYLN